MHLIAIIIVLYTGCPKKNLTLYNVKTIKSIELKYSPMHVERANLDFDITSIQNLVYLLNLFIFPKIISLCTKGLINIKKSVPLSLHAVEVMPTQLSGKNDLKIA